jgi:zinc transporter ZupT
MAWIISFSLLGSVGALAGAALLLVFPEITRRKLVPNLISFASGTLLGAAFLCMIPAGIRAASAQPVLLTVLVGMVLFFILEKLVLWRHCHESDCEVHGQAAPLILIGDASHIGPVGLQLHLHRHRRPDTQLAQRRIDHRLHPADTSFDSWHCDHRPDAGDSRNLNWREVCRSIRGTR